MSEELKPCPFCGGEAVFHYIKDSKYHCWVECENGDADTGMFSNDELAIKHWNHRPAEDALKAENEELAGYVKRFRETLAEVAQMANNSDQEQIFEKCRDALRDVYLEEKFRDAFDKILHNPDTGKGGEDE